MGHAYRCQIWVQTANLVLDVTNYQNSHCKLKQTVNSRKLVRLCTSIIALIELRVLWCFNKTKEIAGRLIIGHVNANNSSSLYRVFLREKFVLFQDTCLSNDFCLWPVTKYVLFSGVVIFVTLPIVGLAVQCWWALPASQQSLFDLQWSKWKRTLISNNCLCMDTWI